MLVRFKIMLRRSRRTLSQQAAFDEAWLIYRTATKREIDTQSYTHYMDMTSVTLSSFGGETVLPNDGKATFKRNVDRLLSFTKMSEWGRLSSASLSFPCLCPCASGVDPMGFTPMIATRL
jgi:hypothetical protein